MLSHIRRGRLGQPHAPKLPSSRAAGEPLSYLTAVQAEADERLKISASTATELFVVGLPEVEIPEADPDQRASEEVADQQTEADIV